MRILLADDERELTTALALILKHNNYSVDVVADGADALDYAESGNYDALVLDIMMPKKSGLEVLAALRAAGSTVPVLLLTAKGEIDDRIAGLDAGADDYLTKPFATGELLARLRAMTRRKPDYTPGVLTLGNTSLDRAAFELRAPSGSFRLGNKEFQLMEAFMSGQGRVLSAEQLFERIWGYDAEAELNVVWVYISYLRKKLAACGSDLVIRAIRGAGYKLEAKE